MQFALKKIFLLILCSLSIKAAESPTRAREDHKSTCLSRFLTGLNPNKQPLYRAYKNSFFIRLFMGNPLSQHDDLDLCKKHPDRYLFTLTSALIWIGVAVFWRQTLSILAKDNDNRMSFMEDVMKENHKRIGMITDAAKSALTQNQSHLIEKQHDLLQKILDEIQDLNAKMPVTIKDFSMHTPAETLEETGRETAKYFYLAKSPEE
jgi:hypothetical protein